MGIAGKSAHRSDARFGRFRPLRTRRGHRRAPQAGGEWWGTNGMPGGGGIGDPMGDSGGGGERKGGKRMRAEISARQHPEGDIGCPSIRPFGPRLFSSARGT
jgi:hypothetical protein